MSVRRYDVEEHHPDGSVSRKAVLRITVDPPPPPPPTEWERQMQAVTDTCNRAPEAMEELRAWALAAGANNDDSPAQPEG